MLMQSEREQIVEYGIKLLTEGLTSGTGGNISIADKENGLMAISPSGIDYHKTSPKDVTVLNLETCEIVDGDCKPSVEYLMHRIFYIGRDDVGAVVHAHSTYSTAIATLGWDLPVSNYLLASVGKVVKCAPYRTYGTQELADISLEYMEGSTGVLLANHGLIAVGPTVERAFKRAATIEECARVFCLAKSMGEPLTIPDDEIENIQQRFKSYGQPKKK